MCAERRTRRRRRHRPGCLAGVGGLDGVAGQPRVPVLRRLAGGVGRIDRAMLRQQGLQLAARMAELSAEAQREAGQEFNVESPRQLQQILFEKLQYPVIKKTKGTKASSTSVDVLEELASHGFAVPQLILRHRELHKLKSTYIDALPQLVAGGGRVHTSFNQAVAATGLLSSSDPSLKTIPIRT